MKNDFIQMLFLFNLFTLLLISRDDHIASEKEYFSIGKRHGGEYLPTFDYIVVVLAIFKPFISDLSCAGIAYRSSPIWIIHVIQLWSQLQSSYKCNRTGSGPLLYGNKKISKHNQETCLFLHRRTNEKVIDKKFLVLFVEHFYTLLLYF